MYIRAYLVCITMSVTKSAVWNCQIKPMRTYMRTGEEKEEKEQAMDDTGNPEVDRDKKKSEAGEG